VKRLAQILRDPTSHKVVRGGLFESQKGFDTVRGTMLEGDGIGAAVKRLFLQEPIPHHLVRDGLFEGLGAGGNLDGGFRPSASMGNKRPLACPSVTSGYKAPPTAWAACWVAAVVPPGLAWSCVQTTRGPVDF
jgi:hypothetical protein